MFRLSLRRRIVRRIAILRRRIRAFWNGVLGCALSRCRRYRQLESTGKSSPIAMARHDDKESSDLVGLKMSVLGDSQVGKTSFVMKYVGRERESEEEGDMNEMRKTLCIRGVRIAYSIWEVGGARDQNHVLPAACKDSVAILIMFDLTSRPTLNSVIQWYQEAIKWNQVAIPVLIGTKFDDFVKLPMDLQWTIASQARAYAKALNATLFFSSATYNINVTKIFKFITAKLFNLPWNLQRNLTIGEPIIDY